MVVGVARNGKYRFLNEPPQPFIYVCEPQIADRSLATIIRTTGEPAAIARAVEKTALAIDPLLKPVAGLTLEQYTAGAFTIPRMAATLVAGLGLTALVLAALGLFGVIAYSVNQRTREIGVRMALGAQPLDVLRLFVGQGVKLAGIGVLVGALGSFAAVRVLASLLVGVSASDPLTYLAVVVLLGAVVLIASWLPARRAARLNPMQALRSE
jgi:ABC-type antimicrobial peptide transport system permease subunit